MFDISQATITLKFWVLPMRTLQSVASGVPGRAAFTGGTLTALLGLLFHFLIAFTAATVFFAASRKLTWMVLGRGVRRTYLLPAHRTLVSRGPAYFAGGAEICAETRPLTHDLLSTGNSLT